MRLRRSVAMPSRAIKQLLPSSRRYAERLNAHPFQPTGMATKKAVD